MKEFTLKDLDCRDSRYYFPNSIYPRTEKQALEILKICNFNDGKLTDVVSANTFCSIIDRIKDLEYKLNQK